MEPAQGLEVGGQAGGAVVDVRREGGQQLPRLAEVIAESAFAGAAAPGGAGKNAVWGVAQVAQAQRRLRDAIAVPP